MPRKSRTLNNISIVTRFEYQLHLIAIMEIVYPLRDSVSDFWNEDNLPPSTVQKIP